MKTWILCFVLVGTLCISATFAKDKHKSSKKAQSDDHKKHLEEIEEKLERLLEIEEEIEDEIARTEEEEMNILGQEEEKEERVYEPYDPEWDLEEEEEDEYVDPCLDMYCGAGRQCIINDDNEGECMCVDSCDAEVDPRRRVCSNLNETWMSDCELYRQRCLCEDEDEKCLKEVYGHMHIDYYGECQEFTDCAPEELEDFPRRMSEWLFAIMRDMADRQTLSEHYTKLEAEAEQDSSKQWTNAVVWKWCDLDSHPRDRSVSRHELFPIRAPLMALEHCISPFLDSCDPNDDHYVSLKEWATCTKLSDDDVSKLETMCEDIRDN